MMQFTGKIQAPNGNAQQKVNVSEKTAISKQRMNR